MGRASAAHCAGDSQHSPKTLPFIRSQEAGCCWRGGTGDALKSPQVTGQPTMQTMQPRRPASHVREPCSWSQCHRLLLSLSCRPVSQFSEQCWDQKVTYCRSIFNLSWRQEAMALRNNPAPAHCHRLPVLVPWGTFLVPV